jgi:hypothetical protein
MIHVFWFIIVKKILINNFGIFPSLITAFMLILAGFFLSLDWIALYLLRQIFLLFSSFYVIGKKTFSYVQKGIVWINSNVISLEQHTLVTESPSIQLHFPLTGPENIDSFSTNKKNEINTSLLPDLPLLDVGQEHPDIPASPVLFHHNKTLTSIVKFVSFYRKFRIKKKKIYRKNLPTQKRKKVGTGFFLKRENKETPGNKCINQQ